jgi:hypothetical protein
MAQRNGSKRRQRRPAGLMFDISLLLVLQSFS